MPHYFASDIHLRLDKPDRGERFARLVHQLSGDDTLFVVGDLYDFWFVSRQQWTDAETAAQSAILEFQSRGGNLRILSGNHDAWLGAFIERTYCVPYEHEPVRLTIGSNRLHIVHGHMLSRRFGLKVFMESAAFLKVFSRLPNRLAMKCDRMLIARNAERFAKQNRVQRAIFRDAIQNDANPATTYIFGHLHKRIEETVNDSKLFVLGDWKKSGGYLIVDEGGKASLVEWV